MVATRPNEPWAEGSRRFMSDDRRCAVGRLIHRRFVWMGAMLKRLHAPAPVSVPAVMAPMGGARAGQPESWQVLFQPAASPVMEWVVAFNRFVSVIIILITVLVLGLLAYVIARFNEKANPTPSKTTHNAVLEVLWTAVPVIILAIIAVPSFLLLYFMDRAQNPEMTIKAIGHQWYWSYEYPDHGDFTFDSVMIPDDELKEGQLRLLETDNRVVLPVETDVRVLVTASDVIHAWAVPALVTKIDAVPGRINETWVRIEREGTYYGQCSELCGVNHGFMPIAIEAVSKAAFADWVNRAREQFASADPERPQVARTVPSPR